VAKPRRDILGYIRHAEQAWKNVHSVFDSEPLQTVQVDDIEVGYKSFGGGEPLVMIPAYIATMDVWDPHFLVKLATKYEVIVFDNRGMGKTSAGESEFTIDRFADDTAGLIEALGLERANVLGWSIGGDIALSLALNHRDRVRRLVLYAGDCGGKQKVLAPKYTDIMKKLHEVDGFLAKEVLGALFPAWWMEATPDYWKHYPFPRELSNPVHIAKQDHAYDTWEGVYDRLREIELPVLVVTGTEDVSTPPENARMIAGRLPDARLVEFPGAGHGLQYMYPIGLAKVIIDFLGED
jgi:pimeloyl-ACP methyl ester carboxylesterase